MTDTVQVPREATEEACGYAERLAVIIHEKHYSDVPQWRPLTGDLIGLLTQIDNMTAGLTRAAPQATDPRDAEIERLKARRECHLSTMGALAIERDAAQAENRQLQAELAQCRKSAEVTEISHDGLLDENEKLRAALTEARSAILGLINAPWSEAEGSADDWVGYIDRALSDLVHYGIHITQDGKRIAPEDFYAVAPLPPEKP